MLGATIVRGGLAAVAALAAAALVTAIPAQGAPAGPAAPAVGGGTASPSETPTPTPTDTPTPTPTPTTSVPPDDRLLPDLIALPASQLSVQVRSDGNRLRFSSSLGNIGAGPIEVRPNNLMPCPEGQHNSTQIIYRDVNANGRYNWAKDTSFTRHRAGCMIYHPLHHHWHFKASARYELLDPSQDHEVVVAARRKVSFCLRDTGRVPERYGSFGYPEAYGSCTRTSPQGISVGWMDVYQSFLAGQSLTLPKNLADGLYCLRTVVDPINQLVEGNDDNNESVRALRIHGTRVVARPNTLCR